MEYQATFGIDCGVSPGFGCKYPDYVREEKTFSADSPQVAYQNAMGLAEKFADDYLSNLETGLTTVQLLSLRSSDGNVSFDTSKSIVKRNMLEHLLALASESAPNE
jgi:hypothetical protein